VVAENDDIDTAGGNFDAQVSFTTAQGGQYVVYASSVDAPGVGDYTLNTSVTGTVTQTSVSSAGASDSIQSVEASNSSTSVSSADVSNSTQSVGASNSSSDSQRPEIPELKVQVAQEDGTIKEKEIKTTYEPLTGGQVTLTPINAINQGGFGNCYFIAALAATFGKIEDPSKASNATSSVLSSIIARSNGNNYNIKLYDNIGAQKTFTVDNQVLTNSNNGLTIDGKIYGARWQLEYVKPTDASSQTPISASLFEVALAMRQGGYNNMVAGAVGNALTWITGKDTEYIALTPKTIKYTENGEEKEKIVYQQGDVTKIKDQTGFSFRLKAEIQADEIFKSIQTALEDREKRYVAAGTRGSNDQKPLYNGVLQEGHAYSVHNAYVDAQGRQMILLRNPWGKDNDNNPIAKAEEDPSKDFKDGFIAITFDAFLKNFDSLNLTKATSYTVTPPTVK